MMRKTGTSLILGTLLLAACGGGNAATSKSQAQAQATSGPRLDIGGAYPGMPVEEAVAKLKAGGWKVTTEVGDTWDDAIERRIRMTHNDIMYDGSRKGIRSVTAQKGLEKITLSVRQTPTGGQIGTGGYEAPWVGRDFQTFRRELISRYGKARVDPGPNSTGGGMAFVRGADQPYIELDYSGAGIYLNINEGTALDRSWQKQFDAALAARAGAKTSF